MMAHDAQQGPCVAPGSTTDAIGEAECLLRARRAHHRAYYRARAARREAAAAAAIAEEAAKLPTSPTPPRPVRLPDGTEAVVVWAGDMVTGAGVRGGLLADRRSAPDPLSDMAPGNWDDEARAARRRPKAAKVRRHRRPVHVVSGPRQRRTA